MENKKIKICLWFDSEAEEAARFYISIFQDSKIGAISRFGKEGFKIHGKPEGTAMTIDFTLNGMDFTALNGGPKFKFNEAVSIIVYCDTQDEIDHCWSKLTKDGEEGPCGWLKDKYGISWQITPSVLPKYLSDEDIKAKSRVEQIAFQMKKFEISKLRDAYEGK